MTINSGDNTEKNLDVHSQVQSPIFPPELQQRYERLEGWVDGFLTSSPFLPNGPILHYTSLQGCIGILKSDSIWMSSARSLNDPYEITFAHTIFQRILRHHPSPENLGDMVFNAFLRTTRTMPRWFKTFIASFSREYESPNQWTNYGDEKRGVCLVLSPELFTPAQRTTSDLPPLEQVFVDEVRYGPKAAEKVLREGLSEFYKCVPAQPDGSYSLEEFNKFALEMQKQLAKALIWISVTTKARKWRNEREIRLIINNQPNFLEEVIQIRHVNGKSVEFVSPKFKQVSGHSLYEKGSNSEIIMGKDAPDDQFKHLSTLVESLGIDVQVNRSRLA